MRTHKSKSRIGYILVAPVMLGCFVFYGIPFVMMIFYSLRSSAGRSGRFVGLTNFKDLFGNTLFIQACVNTLRFMLIGLPLLIIFAYVLALILRRYVDKFILIKSILLFPYIMPVVGTVFLVEHIFSDAGWLNQLLMALGFDVVSWLESSYAFVIVLLLYLWKNVGYAVILLLSGLTIISEEEYMAASLDGANGWQKFKYITTPHMRHCVFFTILFSIINAFKCFREIFLIGGKHPGNQIYMLQHYINNTFENLNYSKLSSAALVLFGAVVIVIGCVYLWLHRKEAV